MELTRGVLQYNPSQLDDGGLRKATASIPPSPKTWDLCVVGAGLSGAVIAERFATLLNKSSLVMDKRRHIAGNCYDYQEEETGLRINLYGPHNFHTRSDLAWRYVTHFDRWTHYYHKKLAWVNGRLVPLPVNAETVNALYNVDLRSEEEIGAFLSTISEPCPVGGCQDSEQQGRATVGGRLFDAIFSGYTMKQWGRHPRELDASVVGRIPVRKSFDNRYFDDRYQGLPHRGYTRWMANVLQHPLIDLALGVDWFDVRSSLEGRCGALVFTGPIDRYFESAGLPRLQYRSLKFEKLVVKNIGPGYYQAGVSINFPGADVPHTRSTEYKWYLHQRSNHTVVVRETSNEDGEPYYPVPSPRNRGVYAKYASLAEVEETKQVFFVGRLANYKYFNMDQAILNAMSFFERISLRVHGLNVSASVGLGVGRARHHRGTRDHTVRRDEANTGTGLRGGTRVRVRESATQLESKPQHRVVGSTGTAKLKAGSGKLGLHGHQTVTLGGRVGPTPADANEVQGWIGGVRGRRLSSQPPCLPLIGMTQLGRDLTSLHNTLRRLQHAARSVGICAEPEIIFARHDASASDVGGTCDDSHPHQDCTESLKRRKIGSMWVRAAARIAAIGVPGVVMEDDAVLAQDYRYVGVTLRHAWEHAREHARSLDAIYLGPLIWSVGRSATPLLSAGRSWHVHAVMITPNTSLAQIASARAETRGMPHTTFDQMVWERRRPVRQLMSTRPLLLQSPWSDGGRHVIEELNSYAHTFGAAAAHSAVRTLCADESAQDSAAGSQWRSVCDVLSWTPELMHELAVAPAMSPPSRRGEAEAVAEMLRSIVEAKKWITPSMNPNASTSNRGHPTANKRRMGRVDTPRGAHMLAAHRPPGNQLRSLSSQHRMF